MRTNSKAIVGVLVAVVIVIAGIGGWLLRDPGGSTSSASTPEDIKPGVPTIVSPDQLRDFMGSHAPVYWAGQRPDTELEVTLTGKNAVFVRYLPASAPAGDTHQYLTVATYHAIDGFGALSGAQKDLADVSDAQSGAVIAVFKNRPLSTYFSFRNAGFQVEVFSPQAGESKQLTDDGAVKLVGGTS